MNRRTLLQSIPALAILGKVASAEQEKQTGSAPKSTPVYELRVYHAYEGKLGDLLARFRDHTTRLFEKHGMRNVAYWTATDEPMKNNTLIYVLAHRSRDAAAASWKAFVEDPEWLSVRDKSEANGKLVEKVDSTFMVLTDFSGRGVRLEWGNPCSSSNVSSSEPLAASASCMGPSLRSG